MTNLFNLYSEEYDYSISVLEHEPKKLKHCLICIFVLFILFIFAVPCNLYVIISHLLVFTNYSTLYLS